MTVLLEAAMWVRLTSPTVAPRLRSWLWTAAANDME